MTRRYVCLHGHFYQPPRENPWLEEIEVQDSASPFHDWNERISAECYRPNSAARLKTFEGRITDIVNNYDHLSFNFGPTLLSWLERASPEAYARVLQADAESVRRRGHGNALAQAYSHPILPLSSPRDRRTQIRWGLSDFHTRFGRDAEGFWLPETAADLDTLRDLALAGVRFTILSPFQATRVRAPGGDWQDAIGARFDPSRPYRVALGGNLSIVVFFYDAPIAQCFAFGNGGTVGEQIVQWLDAGFDASRGHDELVLVAVDGETFGHHRKGFDESLAQAFRRLEARPDLEVINLGQALERIPVEWEAEIANGASWSCAHGLERWKSDCGCSANGQLGWNQSWRAPLREALDMLRGHLLEIFEREGTPLFADPWGTRDAYIELILDRERGDAAGFLERHTRGRLDAQQSEKALKLLEMQRHGLLMYTSCGWFFAELSGLETVQILKYAARAIQLAREVAGIDLEPLFRDALANARSNLPRFRDGAGVWDQCVHPSVVTLEGVAAHHAIASTVETDPQASHLAAYPVEVQVRRQEAAGSATLSVGRLVLEGALTRERLDSSFFVLHFGGPDFRCGLRPYQDPSRQLELERALFGKLGSLAELMRELDRLFPGRDYSLRDLFLDERRRLARVLLSESLRRYESGYLKIYEANRRLMDFLREIDSPIPMPLRVAADVALSGRLRELASSLARGASDRVGVFADLLGVVSAAQRLGARLDLERVRPVVEWIIADRLEQLGQQGEPGGDPAFELIEVVDLGEKLGLRLDLSAAQNRLWELVASPQVRALDRDRLERLAGRLWFDPPTLLARASRPSEPAPAPAVQPMHA